MDWFFAPLLETLSHPALLQAFGVALALAGVAAVFYLKGRSQRAARKPGQVLVQVLLEIGVVALDDRHAERIAEPQPGVVCGERRMHVDDVEAPAAQLGEQAAHYPRTHQAVFRVEVEVTRRDTQDLEVVIERLRVLGCDQRDLVPLSQQFVAEGADRRRHAVDAWKVDVGDFEDAHAARIGWRSRDRMM